MTRLYLTQFVTNVRQLLPGLENEAGYAHQATLKHIVVQSIQSFTLLTRANAAATSSATPSS